MTVLQYVGHYFPSVVHLEIKNFSVSTQAGIFAGNNIEVMFGSNNSIVVNFEINRQVGQSVFENAWQQANAIVKGALDLAAFLSGTSISYSLEFREDADGLHAFIMHDERLPAQLSTAFLQRDIGELLAIISTHPQLRLMMADLNEAIDFPPARLINCARAIETIRHHLEPNIARGEVAWQKMREHLRISRSYLTSITSASKDARHGKRDVREDEEILTDKIMQRTWTIVGRYFEYKIGNNRPLDAKIFPYVDLL